MTQAASRSIKIMKMQMFILQDKAKWNTENMKGLKLAAVKLMTVHVTKRQGELDTMADISTDNLSQR
jgi:hypothetical protein